MLNYIMTQGGVHIVLNGRPVAVAKSDKAFEAVVEALKRKATVEEIQDILDGEKKRMEQAVQVTERLSLNGGQVCFENVPVAGLLGERMLQMLDEGFDLSPMENFIANLQKNPSKRVVDHLYAFLEHGKSPITEDGCFLAYKAVREDFKDIHSGTFDNSVGQVVEMPRNRVDEDPNNTCSQGLHVCSFEYLPNFAHANGHVMVCKVSPADVVAIPADYNNTKMRVCRYEVIGEHEGYYDKGEDVLSNTAVSRGAMTGTFVVEGLLDGSWEPTRSYDRLSDAAAHMEELLGEKDYEQVRITNRMSGSVVDVQVNVNYGDDYGGEDEETYTLYGIDERGFEKVLGTDYDSVAEAVSEALDFDGYVRIEVRDSSGTVKKSLS